MSKNPKNPAPRRLVCPDCGRATIERQLRVQYLPIIGQMIECPRCLVGSKVAAWRRQQ